MRKFIIALSISLLICGPVGATLNHNSQEQGIYNSGNSSNYNSNINHNQNHNLNNNTNSNSQDQSQGQLQGQLQGQAQGQIQGNIGLGSGNSTNVSFDSETNVISPTWAPTPSTAGKEEGKVYTLWGGIDENNISRDRRVDHQIVTLKLFLAEGLITSEEYKIKMLAVLNRLERENSSRRVLGILWKTEGKHLGNLFGLLAIDDLWAKFPKRKKTQDKKLDSGNKGYIR